MSLNTTVPTNINDTYAVPSLPIENISNKEDKANKGVANGYAPLDGTGKVPEANLPVIDVSGQISTHNSDTTSVHGIADTANLSLVGHTHAISDVTNLQTTLDTKSPLAGVQWTTRHTNSTGNPYVVGSIVYHNGRVYRCLATNDSIEPHLGGNPYWADLGVGYLLPNENPLIEGGTINTTTFYLHRDCVDETSWVWIGGPIIAPSSQPNYFVALPRGGSFNNKPIYDYNEGEFRVFYAGGGTQHWYLEKEGAIISTAVAGDEAYPWLATWPSGTSVTKAQCPAPNAGGSINTSGGERGAGGVINISNGGGSITSQNGGGSILLNGFLGDPDNDVPHSNSGSINLSALGYDNSHGGNITSTGINGYAGGTLNMSANTNGHGGSINTSGEGGSIDTSIGGGSINTSNEGGSINTSGDGGSINTSNGGGYINTSGDASGNAGGYIDTSATNGLADGGYINTTGADGTGGFIDTRGNNNGNSGGSINTSGGDEGSGGNINTSGGSEGAGGSINTSNGGGSINTTGGWAGSGGSINTSAGESDGGGSINTSGSETGSYIGGSINTSGGASGAGGSINTSGGYAGDGGSINTSDGGGSINISSHGGSIVSTGGSDSTGGSINLSASASANNSSTGGSISLLGADNDRAGNITSNAGNQDNNSRGGDLNMSGDSKRGGDINTSSGTHSPADNGPVIFYGGRGGDILTGGGSASGVSEGRDGGSINTSDGGGSINTRGTGSIQLGVTGTRTTLNGSASGTDKTITLPNATGTIALTNHTHAISDVTNLQSKLDTKQEYYYTPVTYSSDYTIQSTLSDTGSIERHFHFTVSGTPTFNPTTNSGIYINFPTTGKLGDIITITNSFLKIDGSVNNVALLLRERSGTTNGNFGSLAVGTTQSYVRKSSNSGFGNWTYLAPTVHSHGNISNTGAVGTTANLPLITTTNGAITAGSFGTTSNTFCQGNDVRLGAKTIFTLGGDEKITYALGGSYVYGGQITRGSKVSGGFDQTGLFIQGNWTITGLVIMANYPSTGTASVTYSLVKITSSTTVTPLWTAPSTSPLNNGLNIINNNLNVSLADSDKIGFQLTIGGAVGATVPTNINPTTITAHVYCVPR